MEMPELHEMTTQGGQSASLPRPRPGLRSTDLSKRQLSVRKVARPGYESLSFPVLITGATYLTMLRILLIPVFVVLAVYYAASVQNGSPVEGFRWAAVTTFIVAAASDGLDGWIARRFNQKSRLGAVLDPIADKGLVLTALITLSVLEWGDGNWHIPYWFSALVIARDIIILGGVAVLRFMNQHVRIDPHWSGKTCTFLLMLTLAWVMLKVTTLSPLYPTSVAAVFVVLSGFFYIREGIRQLHEHDHGKPE